jgi:hypothetical protein
MTSPDGYVDMYLETYPTHYVNTVTMVEDNAGMGVLNFYNVVSVRVRPFVENAPPATLPPFNGVPTVRIAATPEAIIRMAEDMRGFAQYLINQRERASAQRPPAPDA